MENILKKLKIIEFYIIMSIPVLFGMITYKQLKEIVKKAERKTNK